MEGAATMSCYICSFGLAYAPTAYQPSPLSRPVVVGTCHKCHVHACDRHGTRYPSEFKCAICQGSKGLIPDPDERPDVATADDLFQFSIELIEELSRFEAAMSVNRMVDVLGSVGDEVQIALAEGLESTRLIQLPDSIIRAAFARQALASGFSATPLPPEDQLSLFANRQMHSIGRLIDGWRDTGAAPTTDPQAAVAAMALFYTVLSADQSGRVLERTGSGAAEFPNPWAIPGALALPAIGWLIGMAYFEGWGTGENSPLDPDFNPLEPTDPEAARRPLIRDLLDLG